MPNPFTPFVGPMPPSDFRVPSVRTPAAGRGTQYQAPAPPPGRLHYKFTGPTGKSYEMPWDDAVNPPDPLQMAEYAYQEDNQSLWSSITRPLTHVGSDVANSFAEPWYKMGEEQPPTGVARIPGVQLLSRNVVAPMIQGVGEQADSATSLLGIGTLGGGLAAGSLIGAASPTLNALGRVGQGAEIAGSGALGLHGANRMWEGETAKDKAMGGMETALGLLGMYSGATRGRFTDQGGPSSKWTPPERVLPEARETLYGSSVTRNRPRIGGNGPTFTEGEILPDVGGLPSGGGPGIPPAGPRFMSWTRGLPPSSIGDVGPFEAPGVIQGEVLGLPSAEGLQFAPQTPQPPAPRTPPRIFFAGRGGLSQNIGDVTDISRDPRSPQEAAFNSLIPNRYKPSARESNTLEPTGPYGHIPPVEQEPSYPGGDVPALKPTRPVKFRPEITNYEGVRDSEVNRLAQTGDPLAVKEMSRRLRLKQSIPDPSVPQDVSPSGLATTSPILPARQPQIGAARILPKPDAISATVGETPVIPDIPEPQTPTTAPKPKARVRKPKAVVDPDIAPATPEQIAEIEALQARLKEALKKKPTQTPAETPAETPVKARKPEEEPLPITTTPAVLKPGDTPTPYATFNDAAVIKLARRMNPEAVKELARRGLMKYIPGAKRKWTGTLAKDAAISDKPTKSTANDMGRREFSFGKKAVDKVDDYVNEQGLSVKEGTVETPWQSTQEGLKINDEREWDALLRKPQAKWDKYDRARYEMLRTRMQEPPIDPTTGETITEQGLDPYTEETPFNRKFLTGRADINAKDVTPRGKPAPARKAKSKEKAIYPGGPQQKARFRDKVKFKFGSQTSEEGTKLTSGVDPSDAIKYAKRFYQAGKKGWQSARETYEKGSAEARRQYAKTATAREAIPKKVREPVAGYARAGAQTGKVLTEESPKLFRAVGESGLTQLEKMGDAGRKLAKLIQKSRIWEEQLAADYENKLLKKGASPDKAAHESMTRARKATWDYTFGEKFETLKDMVEAIPAQDRERARTIINRHFDRVQNPGKDYNKATKVISEIEAATKLSQFFISNIPNLAMTGGRSNIGAMLKAGKKMVMDYKGAVQEAHDTGALQPIMAELQRELGAGEVAGRGKKFSVGKLYGIEKGEELQRTFASIAGKHTADDLFAQVKAGKGGTTAENRLKELLLEDDLSKITKQKGLTEEQRQFAGNRMSEITQGRAGSIDLPPLWSRDPVMNLAFQFKRFAFAQSKNIKAGLQNDPKRMIAMMLTAMPVLGEGVGLAKDSLNSLGKSVSSGKSLDASFKELRKKRGKFMSVQRLADDYSNAWALGLVLDLARSFGRGESGFSDFAIGPTMQDISRTGSAAYDFVTDRSKRKASVKKVKKQITETVPFFGRGLSEGMPR